MNELTVTGEELDASVDELWNYIFDLADAIKNGKSHYEIADAKEQISWQIIEYGNMCWLRGRQNNVGGE